MNKSTTGLHILLVLSIIYGSLMALSMFFMAAFLPQLDAIYRANEAMMPSGFFTLWDTYVAIPRPFFLSMGLLSAASVTGCVLMWNLRRSGYHCYAIAQLLMLALPLLFLGKAHLGIGDIMFTALFLLLYYMQMKKLGVFDGTAQTSDVETTEDTSANDGD